MSEERFLERRAEGLADASQLPLCTVKLLLPAFAEDDSEEEVFQLLEALRDCGVEQLDNLIVATTVVTAVRDNRQNAPALVSSLVAEMRSNDVPPSPQVIDNVEFLGYTVQGAFRVAHPVASAPADGEADFARLLEHFKNSN